MPSTLDLTPGESLGAFHLGSLLFNVLNHIRSYRSAYPEVKLAWDTEHPSTSSIHILLSNPLLYLSFDALTQRLARIEVTSSLGSPGQWVSYRGKPLRQEHDDEDDEEDAVKTVRRVLGPTYGSSKVEGGEEDMLSYPGVALGATKRGRSGSTLSRIIVTPLPIPPNVPVDQAWLHPQLPESPPIAQGDLKAVDIILDSNQRPSSVVLHFHFHVDSPIDDIELKIGTTTSEDILCDLGTAVRSFWKEDDRMSIHAASPSSSTTALSLNPYFLSYPHLGLTLLVQPSSSTSSPHLLSKIILHSNLPGEVNFGRTSRCNWRLVVNDTTPSVSSDERFETIRHFLKDPSSHNSDSNAPPSSFTTTSSLPIPTSTNSTSTTSTKKKKSKLSSSTTTKEVDLLSSSSFSDQSTSGSPVPSSGRTPSPLSQSHKANEMIDDFETSDNQRKGGGGLGDDDEKPMILDRTADGVGGDGGLKGKTTEIHGFPGIAFEVTTSGDVETVWLF